MSRSSQPVKQCRRTLPSLPTPIARLLCRSRCAGHCAVHCPSPDDLTLLRRCKTVSIFLISNFPLGTSPLLSHVQVVHDLIDKPIQVPACAELFYPAIEFGFL